MSGDPRNILVYTKAHMVEQIMALCGRDKGQAFRRELEAKTIEQLREIINKIEDNE